MTQKTNQNPWTMDVRVRERNLKSGALTDKDLEKFLAALPDVADQAEPFATSQPALAQQHAVVSAAPSVDVSHAVSEEEEEEEEEEGEEEEAGEEPVAAVEQPVAAPETSGEPGEGEQP
jgi:hypothetical protein